MEIYRSTPFTYMRLLAMVYMTFLMSSTIMAYKIVNIFGFNEPGSTLIYTSTFFLGNVFSELYGKKQAIRLILESIFCGYVFAFLISGVNALPSPDFWNKYSEYNVVIGHIIRFTNAGVLGYLLSALLNNHLLTRWKYKLNGKHFWLRSLAAASISEGIPTFIAGLITFFGMVPIGHIIAVMSNALIFKLIYGLIAVWPATFLVFLLKKSEPSIKLRFPNPN